MVDLIWMRLILIDDLRLCREGELDGFAGTLHRMTKHGQKPNPHVCNAIVNILIDYKT